MTRVFVLIVDGEMLGAYSSIESAKVVARKKIEESYLWDEDSHWRERVGGWVLDDGTDDSSARIYEMEIQP